MESTVGQSPAAQIVANSVVREHRESQPLRDSATFPAQGRFPVDQAALEAVPG